MKTEYATSSGTENMENRHPNLEFTTLGQTGLKASRAGFGCYRVAAGVRAHEEALQRALLSGINLIDTSANYADGESEVLVGQVINRLIAAGKLARDEVILITKGGYLQGKNFTLSQERRQQGKGFKDLVPYGKGLEHCIHPEFLKDQLDRSLERLGLKRVDGYLLHNPEYYLDWAHQSGIKPEAVRREYDRRIELAFKHLEGEVANGRIGFYGISSNTFPTAANDPEFTCLEQVWNLAQSISPKNHFRVIQMPLNLFENSAVLEQNHPSGQSVLQFAREKNLGVLINRPLNAFHQNKLIRLAEIEGTRRQDFNTIIKKIRAVAKSEGRFWRKILPTLDALPQPMKQRIKDQLCIHEMLKHYWRNFGSYEQWRQTQAGVFLPRIQGAMEYLKSHAKAGSELSTWLDQHQQVLETAFTAVASMYVEPALKQIGKIKQVLADCDADWAIGNTLSQQAIRAVRSATGVSTVLVGMRKTGYVEDVLKEVRRPMEKRDRTKAWQRLKRKLIDV